MLLFKKNKVFLTRKKPKSILDKEQMVFIEFLSCLYFNNQSRKTIKKTLNFFNNINSFEDILNSKSLIKKNINSNEIFKKIKLLFESSTDLTKIKYFYDKEYDETNDYNLIKYLKVHQEIEKYFREILKENYSSFSPSLNRYINYQKQK